MKLAKQMMAKPWGRDDIAAAFGAPAGERIGEIWYGSGGEPLPLLVKWLFTSERLSIQVHPSDAQAKSRGLPSGKEECWYIASAEPGAVLGIGTKQPMSAEELRAAALSGEIERLMDWKSVQAGDYFYVPAGTIHAIGPGITLVEVQQYADVTYRLYDYGRPRELHLEDAVAVASAQPYTDARSGRASGNMLLAQSPHLRMWLIQDEVGLAMLPGDTALWLTPLSGSVTVGRESGGVGDCLYAAAGCQIDCDSQTRLLVAAI
ncbi:MAG: class I mannose-6-phosphate isomerase [Sphingorhabdus sp.]